MIKSLVKMLIEGNPMKSIRMGIRQQGTEALKKYLATRINYDELERKQEAFLCWPQRRVRSLVGRCSLAPLTFSGTWLRGRVAIENRGLS